MSLDKLTLPNSPEHRERVCLITMPRSWDFDYHLRESSTANEAAAHDNRGKGEVTWHSISTYPQLRGVADVTRVYIAWKGRVVAWHQADKQRKLLVSDLAAMNPLLRTYMQVGEMYMWVATEPVILPANEIPPLVRPVTLRYGWLTRGMPLLREICIVPPGRLEPGFALGPETITWL